MKLIKFKQSDCLNLANLITFVNNNLQRLQLVFYFKGISATVFKLLYYFA